MLGAFCGGADGLILNISTIDGGLAQYFVLCGIRGVWVRGGGAPVIGGALDIS
ncbi:hypothetical protein KPHES18084_19250 [Corynebacterium ulcerans]|nr:hypothetical protein CULTSU28_20350 [Corynebacterium ulcerans]